MDGDFGDGREGIEVDLLPSRPGRTEAAGDAGGVVSDADDPIGGFKDVLGQGFDIQPFQRRALLQQPKIQVESINITDCTH